MWWPWLLVHQDGWYTEENPEVVLGRSLCQVQLSHQVIVVAAGEYMHGSAWAVQGLHAAASVVVFWNTQSACLKVMFVIRKANTPWCGPLHCVHSISSEGSPETPVNDGWDATRYGDESLRPWDGALSGGYYLACQEGGGNLCFPSILGVTTTV